MRNLKTGVLVFSSAFLLVACSSTPGEKVDAKEKQEVKQVAVTPTMLSLSIDTENSKINWIGSEPGEQHEGTMKIKEGQLKLEADKLIGGKFTMDMNSISVTDLEGKKKSKLEGHLKNGDFFEVEKHPTAIFEITKVEAVEGEENVSHHVTGNLTMKEETKSVKIPTMVSYNDGVLKAETADFKIDRTEWGIVYKSSKVGDMIINDEMGIQISLTAK